MLRNIEVRVLTECENEFCAIYRRRAWHQGRREVDGLNEAFYELGEIRTRLESNPPTEIPSNTDVNETHFWHFKAGIWLAVTSSLTHAQSR